MLNTTDVITVKPDASINEVLQKRTRNKISGIPVVDNTSKLVGVISDSDIVKAFVKVPLTKNLLEKYSKLY